MEIARQLQIGRSTVYSRYREIRNARLSLLPTSRNFIREIQLWRGITGSREQVTGRWSGVFLVSRQHLYKMPIKDR